MKKNILLKKILRLISVITFVMTSNVFAIGPLAGLAGVPVLGGIMGAKAGSAKALLSQAADVVIYLKLFLFILFTFSFAFFMLWIFSFVRRKLKQRRLNKVIRLLELLHSRMISEKNGEISSGKGASKNDLLKEISGLMKKASFKKLVNFHLEARFVRALVILCEDKIEIKAQVSLVDRWQQVFMLQA